MKGFFKDFKAFISKGNILDLAVAVIMGAAFGKIVSSLVSDIIMPLVGTLIGQNFTTLTVTINGSIINYGLFIQNIIDFIIIAFCVFIIIRIVSKIMPKKEEKKEKPKKSDEVSLLEEIRDLLKKKK